MDVLGRILNDTANKFMGTYTEYYGESEKTERVGKTILIMISASVK